MNIDKTSKSHSIWHDVILYKLKLHHEWNEMSFPSHALDPATSHHKHFQSARPPSWICAPPAVPASSCGRRAGCPGTAWSPRISRSWSGVEWGQSNRKNVSECRWGADKCRRPNACQCWQTCRSCYTYHFLLVTDLEIVHDRPSEGHTELGASHAASLKTPDRLYNVVQWAQVRP